jgi:hypothetical protein
MATVGSALLTEIERISAKLERWRVFAEENPILGTSIAISIANMTAAIHEGQEALRSDDPARVILALEALHSYDDED